MSEKRQSIVRHHSGDETRDGRIAETRRRLLVCKNKIRTPAVL